MREAVSLAVAHDVGIGAHVGLPDLVGFGRRRMAISASHLQDCILYQAGALKAFAEAAGGTLQHIKPHSILYVMIQEDLELAQATAAAVRELGPDVLLFAAGEIPAQAASEAGVGFVPEGFVDIDYAPDGSLVRVISHREPADTAARAVRLVREGKVCAADGTDIPTTAESICIHGEAANAPEIAAAIRRQLAAAQVDVVRVARRGRSGVDV
jgi:UPF0271 protein